MIQTALPPVAWSDALTRYSHGIAKQLRQSGLVPGEAIASLLPNSIEAVWASYGIRLAGATEIPLSRGYTLK